MTAMATRRLAYQPDLPRLFLQVEPGWRGRSGRVC